MNYLNYLKIFFLFNITNIIRVIILLTLFWFSVGEAEAMTPEELEIKETVEFYQRDVKDCENLIVQDGLNKNDNDLTLEQQKDKKQAIEALSDSKSALRWNISEQIKIKGESNKSEYAESSKRKADNISENSNKRWKD